MDANDPSLGVQVSPWERRGRVLLALLMVAAFPLAEYRAMRPRGCDFTHFLEAGRYAVEHAARHPETVLNKYLPSVDVPWAALGWLPLPVAMALWYGVGCATWIGLLRTVRETLSTDAETTTARRAALAAGLLATPLALDGLCMGAFHILMVWWMLAGLIRAGRGQDVSGGVLLGLAVWIKLLPVVGVAYLALKRKWRPALIAVGCAVAIDLVLSLAAFRPQAAWDAHVAWWRVEMVGSIDRQMRDHKAMDEDRLSNQSLAQVLRRVSTHLGFPSVPARERVALADFSSGQLKMIYLGMLLLLASTIAIVCRRPAEKLSPRQMAAEVSLVVLSTTWISPVVWAYHHVAALPALAVVFDRKWPSPWLVRLMAVVWLASLGLLGWDLARSAGEMLWISLVLGGMLILS